VFDNYGDDADDNDDYDSEALRIDCIYITVCARRGGEPRKHLRNEKRNPEFSIQTNQISSDQSYHRNAHFTVDITARPSAASSQTRHGMRIP